MPELAEDRNESNTGARILRASAVILLAHLIFKLLGLVQTRLIGQFCDEITRDLFSFGFDIVLGTFFFIGEESLGPALLPVFMREKAEHGEESAWRFAGTLMSFQSVIILLAVAAVGFFPEHIVGLLTYWDAKTANPVYMQLAPLYARYMILGLFGLSLGSTTYMLLNGYKRFFLAALGDAAVKAGIIAALAAGVIFYGDLSGGKALHVLAAGAVLGSILKLLTHMVGLRKEARLFRPGLDWRNPAFRRFLLLVTPLLAGILFAKFRDIFNQAKILTYVQEEGLLAANIWGRKIYQAIASIIPYAVSLAMLPFFCEMVDRGKKDELGSMVTVSSRLIVLLCAPVAALVVALSMPLAQLFYQIGKCSYLHCELIATANACYTLALPFCALECILMQAFFSNRKMLSVTVIGVVFSTLSMAICYVGVVALGWRGADALATVALAFTVSRALKVATLIGVMRRFLPCFPLRETILFGFRITLVSACGGTAAYIARAFFESEFREHVAQATRTLAFWAGLELLVAGLAGGLVCCVLAYICCREDVTLAGKWLREKLRRRRTATV
jgi:putative peptidoglycan lipid II flippase